MADDQQLGYTPFPDQQGWNIGSILPIASRPIPYANALQPQLAVPGIIRQPLNALAGAAQIPGLVARGELGQQPKQLMNPALQFTEGVMGAGLGAPVPEGAFRVLGGRTVVPVEHDPFAELPGVGHNAGSTLEPIEHDPFAAPSIISPEARQFNRAMDRQQDKEALDLGGKIAEHDKLEKAAESAKMTYDKLFEKVER